ncbi:uncharacterized protein LOC114360463 [Ostrinia furnacalis]|uniref:uncharacterized protein LOC114360463 n=1 Tax=Ostrinia furnacalis TaxID=93504 RepID=UPI00103A683D|nr:uncharacterized protein LOC114360463 [Ostrinia furnacalis]
MDVDVQEGTSNSSVLPLPPQGWSKEDKYCFLQALKCSNSSSADEIITFFPSKSPEEIEEMINYYKKRVAMQTQANIKIPTAKKTLKKIPRAPIAKWAKLLTDSLSCKELETETSTALRLIAEFESIPTSSSTGTVDFKGVYHTIANAMEGKILTEDKTIIAILEKCILETAFSGKAFIRRSALRNVINAVNLSDKEIHVFPRPTENHELAALRHLSSQRKYNPLKVPDTFLKPSFQHDRNVFIIEENEEERQFFLKMLNKATKNSKSEN